MKLKHYLKNENLSASAFARLADLKQPTVSRVITGQSKPSLQTMLKIQRATNNMVTAQDFGVPEP